MSRLYGDLCGNRGEATRQGSAASGIRSHVRGWNVGVNVCGFADGDSDEFRVYATGGSHRREADRLIAIVRRDPGGSIEVEYVGRDPEPGDPEENDWRPVGARDGSS